MIGVPIDSRSCLARLISSRLALPARDDQKDGIHHAGEEQRITSGQDRRRVQEHVGRTPCEIDLNAGRALDQSAAPSDEGGLRPARMKLTPVVFGPSIAAGRMASGASDLTDKNFDEPDTARGPRAPSSAKTVRRSPSIKRAD